MRKDAALLCAILGLSACSPAMDWRQVRPDGLRIEASFPCRPASHARSVDLAGQTVTMTMYACSVQMITFGLASADLADVRQVDGALAELVASASRNIEATNASGQPFVVPGMTPQARAMRFRLDGRLPDGRAIVEHAAVFAYGSRVYQATVLGGADAAAVDAFLSGLRIRV
jgi:hypothetical protein